METRRIAERELTAFARLLREEEREPGTVEQYLRDVRGFALWLRGETVTKESAVAWKEYLRQAGYQPESVNSKLAAANKFFALMGWEDCRVRYLKIQKRLFRGTERELTREEYLRLVETAEEQGKSRLALLLETICATGIRVSEVQYITLEAVRAGRAEVALKGKIRTILLPGKLCRKLEKYARKQKTVSGEIFLTRNGKGLSRRQIWAEMKALCTQAGVAASKVFPHNLRHLFARIFYRTCRDVSKLADVLGHSSNEFAFGTSNSDWLRDSWQSERCNRFFQILQDAGYERRFCTFYANMYVYGGIDNLEGKADNIARQEYKIDTGNLLHKLLKTSVYRFIPYVCKRSFEVLTSEFRGLSTPLSFPGFSDSNGIFLYYLY